MRSVIKYILAFAVTAPSAAWGQHCYTPTYHAPVKVVKEAVIVEKQVLVAQFVPLVVTVPAYTASFAPGYQPIPVTPALPVAVPPQPPPVGQAFQASAYEQRMLLILERIEQRLSGSQPLSAQTQPQAHVALFVSRCASCHDAGVAETKGNKFVLTSGNQLRDFAAQDVLKITKQVRQGKMPKGGPPLNEDEVKALTTWLDNTDFK